MPTTREEPLGEKGRRLEKAIAEYRRAAAAGQPVDREGPLVAPGICKLKAPSIKKIVADFTGSTT